METVSDSSYTDGLLDLLKCINLQTHAHKHGNTHIEQVSRVPSYLHQVRQGCIQHSKVS